MSYRFFGSTSDYLSKIKKDMEAGKFVHLTIDVLYIPFLVKEAVRFIDQNGSIKNSNFDQNTGYYFTCSLYREEIILFVDTRLLLHVDFDYSQSKNRELSILLCNRMVEIYRKRIEPGFREMTKSGEIFVELYPYTSKYLNRKELKILKKALRMVPHNNSLPFNDVLVVKCINYFLINVINSLDCGKISKNIQDYYIDFKNNNLELKLNVLDKLSVVGESKEMIKILLGVYFGYFPFPKNMSHIEVINFIMICMENIAKSIDIRKRIGDDFMLGLEPELVNQL